MGLLRSPVTSADSGPTPDSSTSGCSYFFRVPRKNS